MAYKLLVIKDGNPIVASFTTRQAAVAARDAFQQWGALAKVIYDVGTDFEADMEWERTSPGKVIA